MREPARVRHLCITCVRQSQHAEAPHRKQTSVEKEKARAHGNKEAEPPSRLPRADADRTLESQAAPFIRAKHKTGRTAVSTAPVMIVGMSDREPACTFTASHSVHGTRRWGLFSCSVAARFANISGSTF